VKEEAFWTLLKLHGLDLSEKDKKTLRSAHMNGNCIKYKEAVADLHLDLDFAGMGEQKWTLAKKETVKNAS
jgi:hypothetical protein